MTDEQIKAREARLEAARQKRARQARAKLVENEKAVAAAVEELGDRLHPEDARKLNFIKAEILSGRRDSDSVDFIKDTRRRILRPYSLHTLEAAA